MQRTDAPPAAESQVAQSWRNLIKVHPVADKFPIIAALGLGLDDLPQVDREAVDARP
jgi:hypothetical protein